jgi:hypothetical protein
MSTAAKKLAAKQYGRNKAGGMSTLEKIRFTMDVAMKAANEGDANRFRQALSVLKRGLNFNQQPLIALGFLRLYVYCETVLDEREDYPEIARIIFQLKRAWTIAEPRDPKPPVKLSAS